MAENLIQLLPDLYAITDHRDLRYLAQRLRESVHWPVQRRGIGYLRYKLDQTGQDFMERALALPEWDQQALVHVCELLYAAYAPQVDTAHGQVQVKTVLRMYINIDFETGLPKTDPETGEFETVTIGYDYVYIRLHAVKGDGDHKRAKLLSIYADQGMGRGGTGGHVAHALSMERITEADILTAWHQGRQAYQAFIDECVRLNNVRQDDPAEG